jgi:hypothetical protein
LNVSGTNLLNIELRTDGDCALHWKEPQGGILLIHAQVQARGAVEASCGEYGRDKHFLAACTSP